MALIMFDTSMIQQDPDCCLDFLRLTDLVPLSILYCKASVLTHSLLCSSLIIQVEGRPVETVVTLGQYILIEGDDDDNPYVAQLLKFYSDGSSSCQI